MILYSNHAVKQMFKRAISADEVEYVVNEGTIITNYSDDKPYPSKLLLAFYKNRPIHVVCSYNSIKKTTIIITTYEPSSNIWNNNFKIRKK